MNARQGGFSLIEVLVTIGILMVGLLGLAALQTNATMAEMEAYQRSQALVLVQDLADRIAANKRTPTRTREQHRRRSHAVHDGLSRRPTSASGATAAALRKSRAAGEVNAMIGARGCVTEPTPNT
jgi:type IV pilus assembly protein PilV